MSTSDSKTTIVITERADSVHAQLKGHPEIWGCGRTRAAAVGDLILSHLESFNIGLEVTDRSGPKKTVQPRRATLIDRRKDD